MEGSAKASPAVASGGEQGGGEATGRGNGAPLQEDVDDDGDDDDEGDDEEDDNGDVTMAQLDEMPDEEFMLRLASQIDMIRQ